MMLAIEEKDIELSGCSAEFNRIKQEYTERNEDSERFLQKLEISMNVLTYRLNSSMNKKVAFHSNRQHQHTEFVKKKPQVRKKRKWTLNRKRKNRAKYKAKTKMKKHEKLKSIVSKIKEGNTVVNLSNVEVPDAAYIFLSKGLGFVPSQKVNPQDLKYDMTEFIRKLEWRTFFKANPELETNNDPSGGLHRNIKVSGFTHPSFTTPLLEEVKTKLQGWVANHKASNPKPNLFPLELRGKKWLMDKIKDETIFITKADKGGATLIMNFADVKTAIETELFNNNKFTKLERSAEEQLGFVKHEVRSLAVHMEERKFITANDKTLITGLNHNNRPKLAPEYKPESPYAYPLFKIHKLSISDIKNKKIPPNRLVHASKFGPLYRMEKWCSPYLTNISRDYCKEEFILDTGDLIKNMEQLNHSKSLENENVNLFTLDVEKLYPSIQPELALQAIHETLSADKTTDKKTKNAIEMFIKLSFEHSYVTYKNECYKSKVGIPTGGSLSRQIADIFLHWILFVKMTPKLSLIQAIRFWKRFIDDVVGIWRGTRRSFDNFVKQLNAETMKFGIRFPVNEVQFGKAVHVLDLWASLDDNNRVQYRGYIKPTDAKRYLNRMSSHPQSVFNSIPFSQFLRTLRNNSNDETRKMELDQCLKHFVASGYNAEKLQTLKDKALQNLPTQNLPANEEDTLTFPVHYFSGISELKSLLHSLDRELKQLIGDTRVVVAMKKGSSIGNNVVRNKQLSIPNVTTDSQRCNGRGCLQCPLINNENTLVVNDDIVRVPSHLNCKAKNIIYMWVCKLCVKKEVYFGRTTQECHDRTSRHRSCFTEGKWDKSALSMHAKEVHQTTFSLDIFTVSVVKKVSPQQLRREEFRFIDKYRTNSLGLNRYKV